VPVGASPQTDVFHSIYANNDWLGGESVSGPGSSLEQTATLREALPGALRSVSTATLLDVPCGDWNWMQHVDLPVSRYVGMDLVPQIVAANNARFGSASRTFVVGDVLRTRLPRVDAVLCRDLLVHFSDDDVFRALRRIARVSQYVFTTTFTERPSNAPIITGLWRPLNLQAEPFCLPAPVALINEGCTEGEGEFADKAIGAWRSADLLTA
jgi:ubiquinone/menaquinone biosynthesis C-methylase UbiE